jgi:hypothetical protein
MIVAIADERTTAAFERTAFLIQLYDAIMAGLLPIMWSTGSS